MKLCTCTRTCKRLGCCHLLYICLTQNLLHSNFKPLQNLNEISLIFVAIGIYCCCFLFFWRKGEDGEAAVCVSWGLIQLNNGLRRISGNIQLKEEILAHFPKPQNKANQANSPSYLRNCGFSSNWILLYFPLFVCPSVCSCVTGVTHRRDISTFLNYLMI